MKLSACLAEARNTQRARPWITLAHAQTLDGTVSLPRGEPTPISGAEALQVTHQLRSMHDVIAVGINTVLSDDPILDARLVGAKGPRPLILDSHLRTPEHARIMSRAPLIACTHAAPAARRALLLERGAELVETPPTADGRVDLERLCALLLSRGVATIMLEGGPSVITSFTAARLLDYAAVTLSPRLAGGASLLSRAVVDHIDGAPSLTSLEVVTLGTDLLLAGAVTWPD